MYLMRTCYGRLELESPYYLVNIFLGLFQKRSQIADKQFKIELWKLGLEKEHQKQKGLKFKMAHVREVWIIWTFQNYVFAFIWLLFDIGTN